MSADLLLTDTALRGFRLHAARLKMLDDRKTTLVCAHFIGALGVLLDPLYADMPATTRARIVEALDRAVSEHARAEIDRERDET